MTKDQASTGHFFKKSLFLATTEVTTVKSPLYTVVSCEDQSFLTACCPNPGARPSSAAAMLESSASLEFADVLHSTHLLFPPFGFGQHVLTPSARIKTGKLKFFLH